MPKSAVFAITARDFPNVFGARFRENPLLGQAPRVREPAGPGACFALSAIVADRHGVHGVVRLAILRDTTGWRRRVKTASVRASWPL